MSEKPWFYFGCHGGAGHYLWDARMWKVRDYRFERLGHFDGNLCYPEGDGLYVASLTRLGGWGYSALSFWDRTIDKRGGCNSSFFAPSLTATPQSILDGAKVVFPEVYGRLPEIDISRIKMEPHP